MRNLLTHIEVKNFRSLSDVSIDLGVLNILFGPNGSGKSSLLDTLWFIHDCKVRSVEQASAWRDHGMGLRWEKASPDESIDISIETEAARYGINFNLSGGRIEPYVGELLYDKNQHLRLIDRNRGSKMADFFHIKLNQSTSFELREPEKLALDRYLDFDPSSIAAQQIDHVLRYAQFYDSRGFDLNRLRKQGSETSHQTILSDHTQNLWSVLFNLLGKRAVDSRFETILKFMRESFPNFDDLVLAQTSPGSIYGSFVIKGLRNPVAASGQAHGYLQLLILLTALFSEDKERESLILFDEPEISLHPYALSIFAKAVKHAVADWNRQVLLATHSPVLLSQFEPENMLAVEMNESGQTMIHRVSEMHEIQDLLEDYAVGSLYMAEAVAPQSRP